MFHELVGLRDDCIRLVEARKLKFYGQVAESQDILGKKGPPFIGRGAVRFNYHRKIHPFWQQKTGKISIGQTGEKDVRLLSLQDLIFVNQAFEITRKPTWLFKISSQERLHSIADIIREPDFILWLRHPPFEMDSIASSPQCGNELLCLDCGACGNPFDIPQIVKITYSQMASFLLPAPVNCLNKFVPCYLFLVRTFLGGSGGVTSPNYYTNSLNGTSLNSWVSYFFSWMFCSLTR